MRSFLTTFILTGGTAAGLWWHQQNVIASLQAELASRSTAPATEQAAAKSPATKPAKKKHEPKVTLQNPDGSAVVTSRSAMRGALQAAKHVRTLSRGALEALLDGEEPDDMGEYGGLLLAGWGRLGEMDPRAALALAASKEGEGFGVVLHDWLIRDRAAALAWFHEQPDSEDKASFLGVAGFVLATSDPELLAQLTGSIQDPDLQRKSLTNSILAQSVTDPDAAIARFGELTDAESRKQVLQILMTIHGTNCPRQLLELALPMVVEGTESEPMLSLLLLNDFKKNPAEALQWLVGRPTAEITALRAGAPGIAIDNVGTLDFEAVQAAMSRLERPEDREWLLANYHTAHSSKEPLAGLTALSASVNDAALRAQGVDIILGRSVREGTEAEVEPWLAAQPAKEQEAFRKKMATWKANAAKR